MKIKMDKKLIIIMASIVGVVLVGLVFFYIFFGTYRVRSNTMLPNLDNGQIVRASRFDKKFNAGDMVVYKRDKKYFSARIIAGEGEVVRIEQGRIYINGKRISRELVGGYTTSVKLYNPNIKKSFSQNVKFKKYIETLPNGEKYFILESFDEKGREEFLVPKDSFFIIGDNRDFSGDTRSMNGWHVNRTDIKKICK